MSEPIGRFLCNDVTIRKLFKVDSHTLFCFESGVTGLHIHVTHKTE